MHDFISLLIFLEYGVERIELVIACQALFFMGLNLDTLNLGRKLKKTLTISCEIMYGRFNCQLEPAHENDLHHQRIF